MRQRRRTRWVKASFTARFAAVMVVSGAMIAVVPLLLARADTNGRALQRAADKAAIAANLIDVQRRSLDAFAAGISRQLSAPGVSTDATSLSATLRQDESVNHGDDVIAFVTRAGPVVAVRDSQAAPPDGGLVTELMAAASRHAGIVADASGQPWLIGSDESAASVVVARPLTGSVIASVQRSIQSASDPAGLALVRGGRIVAGTPVTGTPAAPGTPVASFLGDPAALSEPSVATVTSHDVAVAPAPLGSDFEVLAGTAVTAIAVGWQSVVLVASLILAAMLVIVIVVQTSLQRPLRRLDRAVAAVGRGDFDVPVPAGSDDELGRLGSTFEVMRRRLHTTIRVTAARAAVAEEMSKTQPIQTALRNVCTELHRNLEVDAVLITVTASEMSDPFTVVDGRPSVELEPLLHGDGPLGAGFRHTAPGALVVGASASSQEAKLGLREFCVAPLRVGRHVHGVLAVGSAGDGFSDADAELVASTAEQVALALERYRFLAVVQRQASIDDLTTLYNHRFLVDYLGQQVALAERLGAPLAILMLDIDHFKVINDTHGHQAGDTALAAFAQTVLGSVRRSDLAARYGGEEFSVVMANTTARDAHLVAEKIRAAVGDMRITLPDGTDLSLSVSIGGAAYPEDTGSAGELLALADAALYRAKRGGRNRTCMAGEEEATRGARRSSNGVVHTPGSASARSSTRALQPHRSAQ